MPLPIPSIAEMKPIYHCCYNQQHIDQQTHFYHNFYKTIKYLNVYFIHTDVII